MKQIILTILILVMLEISSPAQSKHVDPLASLKNNVGTLYSPNYLMNKLSIQQFNMQHQISTGFTMGGGSSILTNAYINSMMFEFGIPLKVQLDLGIISYPYISNDKLGNPGNQFVGNLKMEYKPFKNMMIGIQLYKGPTLYYPYEMHPYSPASYFFEN
ncbi:MAG: hypothetical protein Kow00108_17850 [Calditrichia bacterium]